MGRIFTIGEALIDFIPEAPKTKTMLYAMHAGGAPANVAVQCAILGSETYFIGAFGYDHFASYLKTMLADYGVKVLAFDTDKAQTTLAFVTLSENGEREFSFYRNPGADTMLEQSFVEKIKFQKGDILHFCSVCLTDCPSKQAHKTVINAVRASGGKVSFDVNIRLALFGDSEKCRAAVCEFLPLCDIVKVSEDELYFITQIQDEAAAIKKLKELAPNAELIFITRGGNGSLAFLSDGRQIEASAVRVKAVDTTGAGDSYMGCVLYMLDKLSFDIAPESICKIMKFAACGAALTISRRGAISSLPDLQKIMAKYNSKK